MAARPISSPPLFRQSYEAERFERELAQALYTTLLPKKDVYDIVILCIGSDRSTGDAFGPLVGSHLQASTLKQFHIYGTLDQPVHAINLEETVAVIHQRHRRPLILAVDACLGRYQHVGWVTLAEGALQPGAGVNKKLPRVGDISLTGVVNVGGFMEYFVLQNTRLAKVMQMAQNVAHGILLADHELSRKQGDRSDRTAALAKPVSLFQRLFSSAANSHS